MKYLVDTNVFLDYLLSRDNFEDAKEFFVLSRLRKNQIFVTSMSIRDIGYVVHHKVHDKELANRAQFSTYELCSKVIDITADDAINALFNDNGEYNDYEDGLQIEAADRLLLDAVITSNTKDFKSKKIPVYNLKQINQILKQQSN